MATEVMFSKQMHLPQAKAQLSMNGGAVSMGIYHLAEKLYILYSLGIRYANAYLSIFDIRPLSEYVL